MRTAYLFLIPYAVLTIFLFVYLDKNSTFNPENNHTNTKIIFEDKYIHFYGSMLITSFVIKVVFTIILTVFGCDALEEGGYYNNNIEHKYCIGLSAYIIFGMIADIFMHGPTVIGIREYNTTLPIYKYYPTIECIILFWPIIAFVWYQIYRLFKDCFELCGIDREWLSGCWNFMCCQYKRKNKYTSTGTYGSIKNTSKSPMSV